MNGRLHLPRAVDRREMALVFDVSSAHFPSACLVLPEALLWKLLTSPGLGHLHLPGDPLYRRILLVVQVVRRFLIDAKYMLI